MSKLTAGILLAIGAPVAYVTGVLFGVIPFVSTLEPFGGCRLINNAEGAGINWVPSGEPQEVCWDGVRSVIDPLGVSIAIFFAALFIAGLVLIGLHLYQRRLWRKVFSIVIDIVIVLASLYSIFLSIFYWLAYVSAQSPDCDELRNSAIHCDPASYLPPAIGFSLISILLVILIVMRARKELDNKKTTNNVSQA